MARSTTPNRGITNIAKARANAAQQAKNLRVRVKPGSTPVPVLPPKIKPLRLGLTMKQMIKNTRARTRLLMRLGGVVVVRMRRTKYGFALMCETVTNNPNSNNRNQLPSRYKQVIQNLDESNDKFSSSKWIKCSCSCPDFMYRKDYALWEKGSSDLDFSLPEPPDETNPKGPGGSRNLGVCKHLFKCFEQIVGSGM